MPTVPAAGYTVPSAPLAQPADTPGSDYQRISATPEDFGVGIGAALKGLGGEIEKGSDVISKHVLALQDLKNHDEANTHILARSAEIGELTAKFDALRGQQAADAFPQYLKDITAVRESAFKSIENPAVARLVDSSLTGELTRVVRYGASHAGAEQRKAFGENIKARLDNNLGSIAKMSQDDDSFESLLKERGEIASREAVVDGFAADSPEAKRRVDLATSQAIATRIAELSRTAPERANDLWLRLQDRVSDPKIRQASEHAIANGMLHDSTKNLASDIVSGGQAGSSAATRIAKVWRDRGWNDAMIAGGLNNGFAESGMQEWNNPGAAGELGTFQFHPGSHLPKFLKDYGGDKSYEAQAEYVAKWVEANVPEYKNQTDAKAATAMFLRKFEAPADQSDAQLAERLKHSGKSEAALRGVSSTGGAFDMAGGDSIGYGLATHAKLGGFVVGDKTEPGGAGADAAGSRNPQEGLDFIKTHPERFAGKRVLWSSGLMNAGADPRAALPLVGEQLDAIKAAGGAPVLVGVDQGKFDSYNDELRRIAAAHQVPFAGPLPTKDIHPGKAGYIAYAKDAAKLAQPIEQQQRSLSQMLADADSRVDALLAQKKIGPGTPTSEAEYRQSLYSTIRSQQALGKRANDDATKNNLNEAMTIAMTRDNNDAPLFNSMDQYLASDAGRAAYEKLDPLQRPKVQKQLEHNATRIVPTPEIYERMRQLNDLAKDQPAEFAKLPIADERLPLGEKDRFLRRQREILAKPDLVETWRHDLEVGKYYIKAENLLAGTGIDIDSKTDQRAIRLRSALGTSLNEFQQREKRSPKVDELRDITRKLIGVTVPTSWNPLNADFYHKEVRGYEQFVPKTFRDDMTKRAVARGEPAPSTSRLIEMWRDSDQFKKQTPAETPETVEGGPF